MTASNDIKKLSDKQLQDEYVKINQALEQERKKASDNRILTPEKIPPKKHEIANYEAIKKLRDKQQKIRDEMNNRGLGVSLDS